MIIFWDFITLQKREAERHFIAIPIRAKMTNASLNNWVEYSVDWQLPENGILQVLATNGSDIAVYFDDISVEIEEDLIV